MSRLREQIDNMRKPNDSTRAMAKHHAALLDDLGRYVWIAMEGRGGTIQFRRVTPASTSIITIEVIEVA